MTVVTICCSSRHRDLINEITRLLREAGLVVLPPPLHRIDQLCNGGSGELYELAWKGATFAHFNRIDTADLVLIANPDGYVGASTSVELGYAVAQHKLIVAMAPDATEVARTVLFDVVLNCPTAAEVAVGLSKIAQGGRPEDARTGMSAEGDGS